MFGEIADAPVGLTVERARNRGIGESGDRRDDDERRAATDEEEALTGFGGSQRSHG
jgi:hypothetical protein